MLEKLARWADVIQLIKENNEHIDSDPNKIIDIPHGGTDADNARKANYNLFSDMYQESSVTDNMDSRDCIVYATNNPNEKNGALRKVSFGSIWNWIDAKIRSAFGFNNDNKLPIYNLQGRRIESGEDLNDIKEPGEYYCTSSSIAATLKNCPTSVAFTMSVRSCNPSVKYATQILIPFSKPEHWERNQITTSTPDIWQDWHDAYASAETTIVSGDSAGLAPMAPKDFSEGSGYFNCLSVSQGNVRWFPRVEVPELPQERSVLTGSVDTRPQWTSLKDFKRLDVRELNKITPTLSFDNRNKLVISEVDIYTPFYLEASIGEYYFMFTYIPIRREFSVDSMFPAKYISGRDNTCYACVADPQMNNPQILIGDFPQVIGSSIDLQVAYTLQF